MAVFYTLCRWPLAVLVVLYLGAGANACSISVYGPAYESYPNCAGACLACPDKDYNGNFANNCNYDNGSCCTSASRMYISASWACAKNQCGADAQEAFDTFARFCMDKGVPLSEADIPTGYTFNGSTPQSDSPHGGTGKFSTGQIVGIAVGAVSAVFTAIGTYYGWRRYKLKKNGTPDPEGTSSQLERLTGSSATVPWPPLAIAAAGNGLFYERETRNDIGIVTSRERAMIPSGGGVAGLQPTNRVREIT